MNRRNFLSASAAALVAAPGPELRTAMIGVGSRGGGLLTQVLEQTNVKVAAICDIDPQNRDRALSRAGRDNPRSFTDYRQVLDLKDVDAVVVATPCDLHSEMAAAALEAGKYVYCEKPVGITPEQVDRVLKASRKAKTFLQIGQQLRYFPGLKESIRQIHQDGILGQTFVVKAHRHSTPTRPPRPDEVRRERPAWYDDVKRSGDLIVENAVHNIDCCNWIIQGHPQSAYGHGKKYLPKTIPAGTIMMDGFSVSYTYENGAYLEYSQLYLHPAALKVMANNQWYVIFGEKGAIHLTHEGGGMFYPSFAEPREMISAELKKAKENAMSEFYACIRENRQPYADIKVAAIAALTAIMGREAIYKGRSVDWKELGVTV